MRAFVLAITVCVAGIAGCRETPPATAPAPRARTVAVQLAEVALRPRAVAASTIGVLAARRHTVVSARVTALVTAVLVREGDRVEAGQELFRLDDREPTAREAGAAADVRGAEQLVVEAERAVASAAHAVDAAAAAARVAARTRERLQHMYARGAISAQLRDEAAARDDATAAELARTREARAAAHARLKQAQLRETASRAEAQRSAVARADTRIDAPFAGIIVSRPVDPGTLATPGAHLVMIEEVDPRLECVVPASWAERVRPGDAARVELDAPRERVTGRVEDVAPAADPASHTVLVKIALPCGQRRRSGVFGRAELEIGTRPGIFVPGSAVIARGQLEIVFVAVDGAARVRLVKAGEAPGGLVEVLAGLEPGERVVAAPPAGLQDGDLLEVRP